MSAIDRRADETRKATIRALQEQPKFRPSTLEKSRLIDETCARIVNDNGPLTITNIVEVLNRLFPNSPVGESTIRNDTGSGELYRAIIDAWRTCQFAKSHSKNTGSATPVSADVPDSAINRIQPEEVRISVLLMRTALRNALTQINVLHGMTNDRVIQYAGAGAPPDGPSEQARPSIKLSKLDLNVVRAFLDESETTVRGMSWGPDGELTAVRAGASSGPGVRDVLMKLLAFAEPEEERTRPE